MDLPITIGKSETLNNIRCIIATRNIKKGELIEACPVLVIPGKEITDNDDDVINSYVFEWHGEKDFGLVLGYGSLFNHSYDANAIFKRDFKNKIMRFYAARDIEKGEEIYINYNGPVDDKEPVESYYTNYRN